MRIQTNGMAANTIRSYSILNEKTALLSERISSGLRINRAADDAAGLAISEKIRAQIRGLGAAVRNCRDGVSLIQTAEGSLSQTQSILQRMNDLAVQSATGTNAGFDRAQLAKEYEQLKREIDDISEQTTFNNMKLLDGSLSGAGRIRSAYSSGVFKDFFTSAAQVSNAPSVGADPAPLDTGGITALEFMPGMDFFDSDVGTPVANISIDFSAVTANKDIPVGGLVLNIGGAEVSNTREITAGMSGANLAQAFLGWYNPAGELFAKNPVLKLNGNYYVGHSLKSDKTGYTGEFDFSCIGPDLSKPRPGAWGETDASLDKLTVSVSKGYGLTGVPTINKIDTVCSDYPVFGSRAYSSFVFDNNLAKSGDTFKIGGNLFTFYDPVDAASASYGGTKLNLSAVKDNETLAAAINASAAASGAGAVKAEVLGGRVVVWYNGTEGYLNNMTNTDVGGAYGAKGNDRVKITFPAAQKNPLAAPAQKTAQSARAFAAANAMPSPRAGSTAVFDITTQLAEDYIRGKPAMFGFDFGKIKLDTDFPAGTFIVELSGGLLTSPVTISNKEALSAGKIGMDIAEVLFGTEVKIGDMLMAECIKSNFAGLDVGFLVLKTDTKDYGDFYMSSNVFNGITATIKAAPGHSFTADKTFSPIEAKWLRDGEDRTPATVAKTTFKFNGAAKTGDKLTVGDNTYTFFDPSDPNLTAEELAAYGADPNALDLSYVNSATMLAAEFLGRQTFNQPDTILAVANGDEVTITYMGTAGKTTATGDTVGGRYGAGGNRFVAVSFTPAPQAAEPAPAPDPAPAPAPEPEKKPEEQAPAAPVQTGPLGITTFELDLSKMKSGDVLTYVNDSGTQITHTYRAGDTAMDIIRKFGALQYADSSTGWRIENQQDQRWRLQFEPAGEYAESAPLKIQVGALEGQQLEISIAAMNTAGLKIDITDINTQKSAGAAITAVRAAVNAVSTQRAYLGAIQNRIAHKTTNLNISVENLQNAESRIRDADIAQHMAEYTKTSVLANAATAMLAQANSAPQNVLKLSRTSRKTGATPW